MPRQGVPYPSREICSLKCQIDALQRQINELMKSVNGVQGDGQGNLSLISGDPAVVINNDASQNQIEIALDSSQLPAAAVSSVNSQTGAVVLEADDIPSDGNSDVQTDIDALKALGVNLQGAIGNEVTARGNADAALQGNINTLQASIPGEAANAVANDPTVQQLAVDVPNKVDKITSGSALKAYTHTGATQGEKSVVDGTTADSIAIRDANGRLQAADPASGATDKTLVTANWVSQTGISSPNNLAHKNGSETIAAIWDFTEYPRHIMKYRDISISQSSSKPWIKLFSPNTSRRQIRGRIWDTSTMVWFLIDNQSNTAPLVKIYGFGVIPVQSIAVTFNTGDNYIDIWFKTENFRSTKIFIDDVGNYGGSQAYSVLNPAASQVYETIPTGEYITYSSLGTVIS